MGTDNIAPGTPHIQNQKTRDTITKTGLSVKRLASSIGVIVSPSLRGMAKKKHSRDKHPPDGVGDEGARKQEDQRTQQRPLDGHEIQQKG